MRMRCLSPDLFVFLRFPTRHAQQKPDTLHSLLAEQRLSDEIREEQATLAVDGQGAIAVSSLPTTVRLRRLKYAMIVLRPVLRRHERSYV